LSFVSACKRLLTTAELERLFFNIPNIPQKPTNQM
jgi:hypothetical protein